MAGYSGTPLPKKLGIKPGHQVALLNLPREVQNDLAPLLKDVDLQSALRGPTLFNVIVYFTKKRSELEEAFPRLVEQLDPAGGLWIAWPKKASGVATDLTEDIIRVVGVDEGLVDNKVCAIDETWSGLRVVWRQERRR